MFKFGVFKKVVVIILLAGCFGCYMFFLDIDEELLDVIEFVDFNKFLLIDIKEFSWCCDVGIVEGGCCNSENVEVL